MYTIDNLPESINIGKQGESGILTLEFDCSAWVSKFPDGLISAVYIDPRTNAIAPIPLSQAYKTGSTFYIKVLHNLTVYAGYAYINIRLVDGSDIEKRTAMIKVYVEKGVTPSADMPGMVQDWVNDATALQNTLGIALSEVEANEGLRETAEGLRDSAETSRNTAEGLRLSAETSRNSAEGLRDSAETARREAEALRVAAEAVRMGFKPMGAYNPANENKYGEWYTHEGGSYGYIYPTPSTGVPVTDTSHWQQIATVGGQDLVDAAVAAKNIAVSAKDTAVAAAATLVGTVANGLTAKGASAYASLPTTGNEIGDYYYCSDGSPAGNYVWNGTVWYFGGTGDEGYSNLKDDLTEKVSKYGVGEVSKYNADFIVNDLIYVNPLETWVAPESSYGTHNITVDNLNLPYSMDEPNIKVYIGDSDTVDAEECVAILRAYAIMDGVETKVGEKVINESGLGSWNNLPKNGQTIIKVVISLYSSFTTIIPDGTKVTVRDIRLSRTVEEPKFKFSGVKISEDDIEYKEKIIITVKADGSGDYTNPVKATNDYFWRAWNGESVEIHIYEGEYDIYNSWEDFNKTGSSIITGSNVGWNICHNMTIKGIGDRKKIICKCYLPDTESTTTVEKASCLNMNWGGNVENITFTSRNTRYCCHSDQGGNYYTDKIFNVKNCRFEHLGNEEGFWQYHGGWMEGSCSGNVYNFDECEFYGVRGAYGTHTNTDFTKPSIHRFNNCTFENEQQDFPSVGFESLDSGVTNLIFMNNNYLNHKIRLSLNSQGTYIDNELHGGGNSNVDVETVAGYEDSTKYFVR